MALIKTIDYKGIEISYHKIIKSRENFMRGTTEIMVGIYKNSTTRDADVKNFINRKRYDLKEIKESRKDQYAYLKTLPEYSEAEDDI